MNEPLVRNFELFKTDTYFCVYFWNVDHVDVDVDVEFVF